MSVIKISRESSLFPQIERVDNNKVYFYFDHSSRSYNNIIEYSAIMVDIYTQSDNIDEIKALALPDIKEYRIEQIKAYDSSNNVNDLIYQGKHMWFDKITRATISYSMECEKKAGASTTILIAPDGEKYTLPIDEALNMFAQLELYAKRCFNVTESHKAEVMEMNNADDVIAYDFTAGYPSPINFDELNN